MSIHNAMNWIHAFNLVLGLCVLLPGVTRHFARWFGLTPQLSCSHQTKVGKQTQVESYRSESTLWVSAPDRTPATCPIACLISWICSSVISSVLQHHLRAAVSRHGFVPCVIWETRPPSGPHSTEDSRWVQAQIVFPELWNPTLCRMQSCSDNSPVYR